MCPPSLDELIAVAVRENWCVRYLCTTCGAIPFRTALRSIPREDVIAGLRSLSREFLTDQDELFRLIVSETAFLPIGGDLLPPLEGTPAGERLRFNIDWQNRKYEQRQAYLATQTPEAIAKRRADKKTAREQVTAPHRERKMAVQGHIQELIKVFEAIPADRLLKFINDERLEVPLHVVGGVVSHRLARHFAAVPVSAVELDILTRLAEDHQGYWRKLLDKVSPAAYAERQ